MEQSEEDEARRIALEAEPFYRLIITGGYTLISKSDWPLVRDISMWITKDGYVGIKRDRYSYLHNYLLQHRDPAYPVDHWNEVRHDNRRPNLRIITRAHNTDRPRRLNAEEARLLEAHKDGQLDREVYEQLHKQRNTRKL